MKRTVLILMSLGFLFMAGCSTFEREDPPELTLAGLKFENSTIFESNIRVTLRLINPSPNALEVQGASFKLSLDGHTLGRGVSQAQFEVEGLSTETFEMLFHINNASAIYRFRQIIEKKTTEYNIRGKIFIGTSYGRRTEKIQRTGHFDFQKELENLSTSAGGLNPAASPSF